MANQLTDYGFIGLPELHIFSENLQGCFLLIYASVGVLEILASDAARGKKYSWCGFLGIELQKLRQAGQLSMWHKKQQNATTLERLSHNCESTSGAVDGVFLFVFIF